MINIFFAILGTIMGSLLQQGIIGLPILTILGAVSGTTIVGIAYFKKYPLSRFALTMREISLFIISRLKRPRPSQVDFIINKRKFPTNETAFAVPKESYDTVISPLAQKRQFFQFFKPAKFHPYVLVKIKPRIYLSWVDALYYFLLREFKEIGFTPVVYLYDYTYRVSDEITPRVVSKQELDEMLSNTESYIRSIVGFGCKIIYGSQFFGNKANSRHLNSFLYSRIFPSLVDELATPHAAELLQTQEGRRELLFRLQGYPTVLVAKLLSKNRQVWVIQWELRASKWRLLREYETMPVILSKTIATPTGPIRPSRTYKISDTKDQIISKLQNDDEYGGEKVLLQLCALLLYPGQPDKYSWKSFLETVDIQSLRKTLDLERTYNFLDPSEFAKFEIALQEAATGKPLSEIRLQFITNFKLSHAFLKLRTLERILDLQNTYVIKQA